MTASPGGRAFVITEGFLRVVSAWAEADSCSAASVIPLPGSCALLVRSASFEEAGATAGGPGAPELTVRVPPRVPGRVFLSRHTSARLRLLAACAVVSLPLAVGPAAGTASADPGTFTETAIPATMRVTPGMGSVATVGIPAPVH
jgi:hypothetical protein